VSLPSKTRHGKQGEAFRSVLSLFFLPQAGGLTGVSFEVVEEVMEAKAVFLNPGVEGIQGAPVEPIEMQPVGGTMQPAGRWSGPGNLAV